MEPTRREILSFLGTLGATLPALGVASFMAGRFLLPVHERRERRIVVGYSAHLPRHGSLRLDGFWGHSLILRRERNEILAFFTACTHLGCDVAWHESEREFVCPCHGGRFDALGIPLFGPVDKPLRRFRVREHDGLLTVELPGHVLDNPLEEDT